MKHEIDALNEILAQWRSSHRPPTPYPGAVWKKAVEIARVMGASRASRALKLDYAHLKRKMAAAEPQSASPPDFLEIFRPVISVGATVECVLEIQSSKGCRLRVEAKNLPASDLAALVKELAV